MISVSAISLMSVAETPENGGQDLLLTSEFLKECLEMYSVPSRGFETNPRVFPSKHLNIVDPLKENNNLGRSVSKGGLLLFSPTITIFRFPAVSSLLTDLDCLSRLLKTMALTCPCPEF